MRVAPQARKLKLYIGNIRKNYQRDWDSSDVRRRQMGVALYFIDKLALRAGHEKDEDEADTVGCCTLKVGLGAYRGLAGGDGHCMASACCGWTGCCVSWWSQGRVQHQPCICWPALDGRKGGWWVR
jgi:hypothetical protein